MKVSTSNVLLFGLAACGTPSASEPSRVTSAPCIPDNILAWLTPDTGHISQSIADSIIIDSGTTTSFLNLSRGDVHVHGFHVLPEESRERMPLALYQHWGEGDKTEFWEEAKELARHGWQCVLLDATWFEESFPNRSYVRNGWGMVRDGVLDWRTVLDYLEQDKTFAIDTTRVVFVGHSYGAQIAGILAGIEPCITRFVIMAGEPSTTDGVRTTTYEGFVQWRDSMPQEFATYMERMAPLNAENFVRCGSAPILFQWARKDEFAIDSLDAVRYRKAASGHATELHFYDATHALDVPEAKKDRLEWMMNNTKPDEQ